MDASEDGLVAPGRPAASAAPAAPRPTAAAPWWADRAAVVRLVVDAASGALLYIVGSVVQQTLLHADWTVLAPIAVAVALRRTAPAVALGLGWVSGLEQIGFSAGPSIAQCGTVLVVYSAAAYGRRSTSVAAAASAVVGGAVAGLYLHRTGFASITLGDSLSWPFGGLNLGAFIVVLLPIIVLAASWTAGFAVRTVLARRAEAELRSRAEDLAATSAEQAAAEQERALMARDVHDVVGHSLAVIVAQADSVRFLTDPGLMRRAAQDIAATARASLVEVREVLERTGERQPGDEPDLDALLERVRAAGVDVALQTEGAPGALGAAASLAARRVLQEMLTNALRHGAPGAGIVVRRVWRDDEVVVEVVNDAGVEGSTGGGAGLAGMRERLAAIGGGFETVRAGGRFVARARIPRADPTS